MDAATHTASSPAWSPLRIPAFRRLWLAALVSNIGSWMHEVGAAWLMTSLTTSPFLVALLGSATSLPLFLLALPAGALGDVLDKRKYLLFTQGWMVAVAGTLSLVTFFGDMTPGVLLALTFAMGMGVAMNVPVWQAVTQELVPHEELPAAVSLGGVSINVARAVGPALGGLILAASGPGAVFLINALSYVVVATAIYRWKRVPPQNKLPAEQVVGAIRAGVRYVRNAPEFLVVLARAGIFVVFASASWALLPVVGRHELGLDAAGYGVLMGSLGVGAVAMAMFLPRLRARYSIDLLIAVAIAVFAAVALVLAFVRIKPLVYLAMLFAGAAWITSMASLNVAAQRTSAFWVRARALAFYAIVFQGGLAVGSAVWGAVAAAAGVDVALAAAAAGMLLGLLATPWLRIAPGETLDLQPSSHWPQPMLVVEPRPEDGPVLVTVEYCVAPENRREFLRLIHRMERIRRRDGAIEWGVYQDSSEIERYIETFVVESWAEHLRQHERVTVTDRELERRIRVWHGGAEPVRVRHFLYAKLEEEGSGDVDEAKKRGPASRRPL